MMGKGLSFSGLFFCARQTPNTDGGKKEKRNGRRGTTRVPLIILICFYEGKERTGKLRRSECSLLFVLISTRCS